jgi:predicted permease
MRVLGRDLRHALRMARLHPAFSALVVATMTLGIGLNSAVFSLVNALLLRSQPIGASERLVHVYSSVPGGFLSHEPMAFPDYETLRDHSRSFAGLAAFAWYPLALERGDGSELVMAELVTGNYFATLGIAMALGRSFREVDDRPGAPNPIAVLSHDGWHRYFAGATDIVGRELRLNGRTFTVVGVAPRGFRSLIPGFAPDLWLPIRVGAALPTGITINFGGATPGVERTADRASRWVWVTGRLRPDAPVERARAEVAALGTQLGREFPATNARRAFIAVAAEDVRVSPVIDHALWAGSLLLMGVFGFGLLLASLNIATLFLARALGRRREIATRLALGASRGQLVRQLFLEGFLLVLAGGGLGLLLTRVSNATLGRIHLPLQWPLDLTLAPALDLPVLYFTLAFAVLTAVVFALVPALEATRCDVADMLREFGAGGSAGSSRRLRATLVAVQVAISVVLLNGGGIALRALVHDARVDPGFDPEGAAVITLSPELLGYPGDRIEEVYARLGQRISKLPGVRSVAVASHLPLTAAINFGEVASRGTDGQTAVDFASVGPGYFETMRIPLVAGRPFAETDGPTAPRVVIVNETLARRFWPDAAPLGRRLSNGAEVVGVARDGKYRTLGEPPRPFLYNSLGQDPRGTRTLVVRTVGDSRPLLPAIREAVRELDPRVPVRSPRTLADTVADALVVPRLAAALLGLFGVLGLLLAAIGILGVVAYLARERTHEIGVRLALGASRGAIVRWLLRRSLAPVAAGLAVGIAAAAGGTWAARGLFAGLWPIDLHSLLAAASLLALVGFAAALFPARRAATLDLAALLRQE